MAPDIWLQNFFPARTPDSANGPPCGRGGWPVSLLTPAPSIQTVTTRLSGPLCEPVHSSGGEFSVNPRSSTPKESCHGQRQQHQSHRRRTEASYWRNELPRRSERGQNLCQCGQLLWGYRQLVKAGRVRWQSARCYAGGVHLNFAKDVGLAKCVPATPARGSSDAVDCHPSRHTGRYRRELVRAIEHGQRPLHADGVGARQRSPASIPGTHLHSHSPLQPISGPSAQPSRCSHTGCALRARIQLPGAVDPSRLAAHHHQ